MPSQDRAGREQRANFIQKLSAEELAFDRQSTPLIDGCGSPSGTSTRSGITLWGHKHNDESFRECVIRETGEESELQFEFEFFVADAPTSRLAYESWSKGAKEETFYIIELFEVQLAKGTQLKIDMDTINPYWSVARDC